MGSAASSGDPLTWSPTSLRCFRSLPVGASYAANDPYPSPSGRFSDGHRLTLYVSEAADAATAEFFRRHAELLEMQDATMITLHELSATVSTPLLDVRTADGAARAGMLRERLVSSEADGTVRYKECRELADRVDGTVSGIAYPCAAMDNRSNVVFFGARGAIWEADVVRSVPAPRLDPNDVHALPS